MSSQQMQIRGAIADLFAQAPALATNIFQNRDFTLADGVPSQVHVNLANDSQPYVEELLTSAPIDWDTPYEVVIKARKGGASEADAVADGVLTDAYARVMANQSFGGLAMNVTPGLITFETDEADSSVAKVTWRFTVHHRTQSNTLT